MKILSLQLTGFQTLKNQKLYYCQICTQRHERKSLQKEGKCHEEVNERSSVCCQENWKINSKANKIYINESLTSYRNRLFVKIHEFKKSNKFKFLWTVNGKISLRESKTSTVYKFTTHEEFEEFLDG